MRTDKLIDEVVSSMVCSTLNKCTVELDIEHVFNSIQRIIHYDLSSFPICSNDITYIYIYIYRYTYMNSHTYILLRPSASAQFACKNFYMCKLYMCKVCTSGPSTQASTHATLFSVSGHQVQVQYWHRVYSEASYLLLGANYYCYKYIKCEL